MNWFVDNKRNDKKKKFHIKQVHREPSLQERVKKPFIRPQSLLDISTDELCKQLFPKYSMVVLDSMNRTREASRAYYTKHPEPNNGCVVECGAWRCGVSVLLAKLFSDKRIWVCDSFKGFEPMDNSPYSMPGEPHTPEAILRWEGEECYWHSSTSKNRGLNTLAEFGLIPEQHGIELVEGFIRDSLPPLIDTIGTISCLRVDVDAYAATYECLNLLYDRVESGGVIIFDDAFTVAGTTQAVNRFQDERNIRFNFLPSEIYGCYIIKE